MPAAVRAPKKMDDRQSTGIRARQSPKTCMEEAHATSVSSTDLVELAEVAWATYSPGENPLRSQNNERKAKCTCARRIFACHVCRKWPNLPNLSCTWC